ncbi:MAG: radical SAM family heme chaperone HemW [Clostridiales bacterium]|nr:radical SAM family heme chaperone HemW [Clostridiales bacterium]
MPEMSPSSAYIHIPFCVRKCAYCDFLSFPSCLERAEEYVDALCKEIRLTPSWFSSVRAGEAGNECESGGRDSSGAHGGGRCALQTIYFGGGTPSLLTAAQIEKVIVALREEFGIAEGCEITLEVNPGTVDEEKLSSFFAAGVNRLSIGVQSLDDKVLKELSRIHDSSSARRVISEAKAAGFQNISCDMMLGIPGQTMESVKETLDFLLSQKIPHISLYSLILEKGTPMYDRYGGDIEKFVTQEEDRKMYHYVTSRLKENGFLHYEISNMAREGYESRHNSMYWRAEPYYAFGVGAHYYVRNERGRHVEDIDAYIASLSREEADRKDVLFPEETLSEEEKKKEYMMLGFRTRIGVVEDEYERRFGEKVEGAFGAELQKEISAGLVVHEGGAYRLTEKGVDLANQVFIDYI